MPDISENGKDPIINRGNEGTDAAVYLILNQTVVNTRQNIKWVKGYSVLKEVYLACLRLKTSLRRQYLNRKVSYEKAMRDLRQEFQKE